MKKILNEWKKFVSEAEQAPELKYGNEGFEKRFIDSFSRSTQDRAFLKKIAEEDRFNMTGMTDKIIGQLQAGMSHTWLMKFDLAGAEFIIKEKVDRYLADISEEDMQYLQKFFGTIFGELSSQKMKRPEVKHKRPVAYLGRHQLMDWWIADDGIDMFYTILKRSMEG